MRGGLFAAGAPLRLAAVGAWLVLGAAAIVAVERSAGASAGPQPPAQAAEPQPPSGDLLSVAVTATYDVDQWDVLAGGETVAPAETGPRLWRGSVPPGQEVFIDAPPVDLLADQTEALLVEISGESAPRVFRGEGAASARFTPAGGFAGD